ncbi:MAG: hypothetical protein ACFHVJ_15280 [Aestuariibacter sp.]
MRRLFLILLPLCLSFSLFAQDKKEKEPPMDPEYMGVHGMVLAEANYKLYASHLPLYRKPHNAQILYKVESPDSPLILMVRDADLVTVKPKPFNLERMLRGHKFTIEAEVYLGHFERGGMKVRDNIKIVLSEQIYKRKLEKLEPPTNQQVYDVVRVGKSAKIMIHQIQGSPSYDHILFFDPDVTCMNQFYTSSSIPSQSELFNRLTHCGPMKVFHYEVEDFR